MEHRLKKLFKLLSELTGKDESNTLLECSSDEKLAEDFAAFFLKKITDIRNRLDGN
jgi:hypothetical protein